MKNVIITGANGMIGKLILDQCLNRDDVNTVTVIVRRSLKAKHPKLIEIIHNDFLNFSSIHGRLSNHNICFYCIGVYTGQVPRDEFRKITIDYTRVFAEELKKQNKEITFCFLSGQGADSKERSRIMFALDKGIAENILLKLDLGKTYIFRPGYIYPVTPRKEPNFIYRVMRVLYRIFSPIFPNMGVTSEKLAGTMIDVAFRGKEKVIYENSDIRLYKNQE